MSQTAKKNKFWEFKASSDGKSGDLLLYGPISTYSWWGDEVTPAQFAKDLKALGPIETLNVFINSDGGDVFAGQAIHSQLKRHSATKNVYVDGIAASIASVIAMAGDTIKIPKNAMIMIHNPWSYMRGNSAKMRKMADDLDKIRESILAAYESKTSMERDEIIKLMDAETWLTAEEAVELGFADELDEAKTVSASIDGGFFNVNGTQLDLSGFDNVPAFLAQATVAKPVATPKQEVEVMDNITRDIVAEKQPDVLSAIQAEGATAERARIKALNDLLIPGAEEIVNKAIDEGATPEATAIEILKAQKSGKIATANAAVINNIIADAQAVNAVNADPQNALPDDKDKAEMASINNAFANAGNARRK